jgi:type II protein arginine methyltransferase
VRGRRLLHSLTSAYHVRMMNDARRNLAWDKALRAAIGPDTHALEIGAGAGMLALMAARAGARKVTTCETDPVVAQLAREIVAHNGYAERVDVIGKASTDLVLGEDLDEPADLIFCDIFGDGFFDFKPLTALADARRRLSRPQARVAPAFGAIRVALADWAPYPVEGRIDTAAGFDLTPFAAFAPARITVPLGSPDLRLLSGPAEVFRFDLAALTQPPEGRAEVALAADADATVTGIVQWIRLELDAETVLEARPEPGARFFSAPRFWPLPAPLQVRRGQEVRVCAAHDDAQLRLWRPL